MSNGSFTKGLNGDLAHRHSADGLAAVVRNGSSTALAEESPAEVPASTFLISERLWYRAPEASDVPLLTAWRNDRRLRRWMSPPGFPKSPETVKEWMEKLNPSERGKANDHASFLFGLKGSDQPIGSAGLFAINWIDRQAEFGIGIDPAHWSQGYGREVARQMLEYSFHELDLRRVELHVLGTNSRGIKAYQAAGFVHEGTKRQAAFLDGRWEDVVLMSVLREDWA